jgi:catechol 2,3-dioxygenase-like lactoylglutathione lyase family enzyme
MTMRIGALNIVCTDLSRSLRFYVELLGFTLAEREDWFAQLRCGDREVTLLAVAKEPALPSRYCQRPALSFDLMVDDLASELARLRAAGVALADGPAPNEKRAFIGDPDGLVIELIQSK